jgi:hypothetical protein
MKLYMGLLGLLLGWIIFLSGRTTSSAGGCEAAAGNCHRTKINRECLRRGWRDSFLREAMPKNHGIAALIGVLVGLAIGTAMLLAFPETGETKHAIDARR